MEVYLDHAASSPLAPGVREAMEPWLFENCANPSALHALGRKARQAIEESRERIARMLGCLSDDIIFTSGGTEANNMVIQDYAKNQQHIVVSCIEHDSVLKSVHAYELSCDCDATYVPPDMEGIVRPDMLGRALRPDTRLVSVMAVNNELGTIQPIKAIKRVIECSPVMDFPCRLHVDAVQGVGHISLSMKELGWDFLSLSAHKFGGPKGVGALCYECTPVEPLIHGGGQERGFRPGTENVAGIVGMTAALEYAEANRIKNEQRYVGLFDYFTTYLLRHFPDIRINGSTESRTFSNINILIPGVEAEAVLLMLDLNGIYASAGSACNASGNHPSHVLKAIGLTDEEARSSLRLTMGPETTWDQMQYTANKLVQIINSLRSV